MPATHPPESEQFQRETVRQSGSAGAQRRIAELEVRSPLWTTLTLTWVNNIGAAASLMGIYFVAHQSYAFSDARNLGLGLLQGVTYIGGALTAGWGSRVLGSGSAGRPGLFGSTRTLLAVVLVAMSAVAWAPVLWRSEAAIWLVMGLYSPLSGWLWPLVESYLSAGRSGAQLRRTTGAFNFCWASCQIATFWLLAALMPSVPAGARAVEAQVTQVLWIIPLLALSNAATLALLWALPRRPGGHDEEADAALSPEQLEHYRRLLRASRWIVVLGYLAYSGMMPLLPRVLEGFGLSASRQPLAASTWMISRVAMFALLGVWHGWQGRRITLLWSGALILGGFACVLLAPNMWAAVAGLAVFGLGHGAAYSAGFYYAMEAGSAGVDAGGKHEAVIGAGYTIGPLAALGAEMLASDLGSASFTRERGVVLGVSLLASAMGVLAWRALRPRCAG